jgi:p-aminobenzoyl-glutamate transporter AbgT
MWVNNQVEPASVQPAKKLLEKSVAFYFIFLLIDSIKYGRIPKTAKEHDSVLQGPFVCYHII